MNLLNTTHTKIKFFLINCEIKKLNFNILQDFIQGWSVYTYNFVGFLVHFYLLGNSTLNFVIGHP